jgi:dienelactone hydrolase
MLCQFTLLLLPPLLRAQEEYVFSKGIVAGDCHHYSRKSFNTDAIAHSLYTGKFEIQQEDEKIFSPVDEKQILWDSIFTDENMQFKTEAFRNGYLYLTYNSEKETTALLNVVNSSMLYFNNEPHAGDIYGDGWLYSPVKIRKGKNELLIRTNWFSTYGLSAKLVFPEKPVSINSEDATLPDIVVGKPNEELWGGLVIINSSDKFLTDLRIESRIESSVTTTDLPKIPPLSSRKVGFLMNAENIGTKGEIVCYLRLIDHSGTIDTTRIPLNAVSPPDRYKNTFISKIDGSVQYYAVAAPEKLDTVPAALFLSLHGAGVEAIGQARAYQPKSWGVLVAPTNRRPRGFNWEDWGCIDALEVLELAQNEFQPDKRRIYLTGHSMGGHGTWFMGATFPDKWAAIAPCAGYPSLMAYGSADGKIPEPSDNITQNLLLRPSNGSNVFQLIKNYEKEGIYIHHGDSDKVVPVTFARQMRQQLGEFHTDFSYYEYPGGSHWFSNQSVDWPPLFEYFKWHKQKPDSAINHIDFSTANPAISSSFFWASVLQQEEALKYSRINLERDIILKSITGTTENAAVLAIRLTGFSSGDSISFTIDEQSILVVNEKPDQEVILVHNDQWRIGNKPAANQKSNLRNGTFKEPFHNEMVLVYGTSGTGEENSWSLIKACFDAETWYYRANGSLDIIADSNFSPADYPDQGIIIYGNSNTNSAYDKLLNDCPIQAKRGEIRIGNTKYKGDDLGAYYMWPRFDSKVASVAVVTGTGLVGMKAANSNRYFSGGSGFPDYLIFTVDMLTRGIEAVKDAGFYTNTWKIEE